MRNKERGREKEGKDREEEGMVINCHSWAGCSPTKHISAVKQLILIMHVKGTTLLQLMRGSYPLGANCVLEAILPMLSLRKQGQCLSREPLRMAWGPKGQRVR